MTSSVSDEETRGKISSNEETKDKTVSDTEIGAKPVNDEECGEEVSWRCWIRTLFAASGAMLIFAFNGVAESQSATMLLQLKKEDSHIRVTQDEETWIASLGILLSPLSALVGGPGIDRFGRKKGIQFYYVCMGLGYGIIACATNVSHLYIGRSICGFALGLEAVPVVYLAEISTKRQRSIFFSLVTACFSLGIVLSNTLGYLPYPIASAIFSLVCFGYFILQAFTPESPSWLYNAGRVDASIASLERLGRSPTDIQRELEILKTTTKNTDKFTLASFFHPTVYKPFLILCLFHFIQSGTGVFDILYYTVDFVQALGTGYDPLNVSILMSIIKFVTTSTIGVYFTASASRKSATAFSSFWVAVTFGLAGVYAYVYRDVEDKPLSWFPIALILVSIAACSIGITCLPWIMAGEVFPLRVRGAMSSAAFLVGAVLMFFAIKVYAVCIAALKIWGLMWLFAAFGVSGVFFGMFVLPETQNKTLYEIEQGFLPKEQRMVDKELVKIPEK